MSRGDNRRGERDDARDDARDDQDYGVNGHGDAEDYARYDETGERYALLPLDESAALPARYSESGRPVIIPGSGVSMGEPFIKRRERPLTMRLAMLTLGACILVTGLFAVTALGGADASGLTSFEALSGAVVFHPVVSYRWYVAQANDTIEGIADKFHVQIGGIYELNNMLAGQELELGQKYKIPDDPFYGKNYRPRQLVLGGNGSTTFGSDWWNSYAGAPNQGAKCAPYDGTTLGYHMVSPNPSSSWVRGFSWFHNGIDLSAPYGNPIVAAEDGQVLFAGWTNTGFGYAIKINHCNHISTLYGHMAQLLVKAGDNVSAGQPIGLEGSTGWSTGPHLHFSLFYDNQFVDPFPYYNYSIYNITHSCGCYTAV